MWKSELKSEKVATRKKILQTLQSQKLKSCNHKKIFLQKLQPQQIFFYKCFDQKKKIFKVAPTKKILKLQPQKKFKVAQQKFKFATT